MTIRDAFRNQARHCAALGSPFMERLMTLAAERVMPGTKVGDRILGWTGDAAASADSVPLRFAGALHALKLQGVALVDVYPPNVADEDALWSSVQTAIATHEDHILRWLGSAPQTNEVRRAAVLLPSLAVLHRAFGLPVELLEPGTSAGLNLRADHFNLRLGTTSLGNPDSLVNLTPDWRGPLPPSELPPIIRRAGVDLSPLDPSSPDDQLRLLAYLWADQPDRIERTRAAIAIAQKVPAEISAADAGAWLEKELSIPAPDRLRVVFHTIAWQYFPDKTRARAEAAMNAAQGPLARIAMEFDGGRGAGVTLARWPGGETQELARVDFHGRWVEWSGVTL